MLPDLSFLVSRHLFSILLLTTLFLRRIYIKAFILIRSSSQASWYQGLYWLPYFFEDFTLRLLIRLAKCLSFLVSGLIFSPLLQTTIFLRRFHIKAFDMTAQGPYWLPYCFEDLALMLLIWLVKCLSSLVSRFIFSTILRTISSKISH